MIWLAGAFAFSVRLMGGWFVAVRLRTMLVRPAPEEWRRAFDNLKARLGVSGPVRLLVSPLVQVPTVVGWLRPIVLAPLGALSGLPTEHMEALLIHELAHIRRRDYLVNILQSIVETLLFYHPAVWWVSGHIRAERELCCDDVAVALSGDALTYARALAELESFRPEHLNPAVAANGGSLADRIGRLLGQSRLVSGMLTGPEAMASALLLIVTAYGLLGQSTPVTRFEVASVKPNTAAVVRVMMVAPRPGGRLVAENAPLWMLIQNAYKLQRFQISGGPGWIDTDHFDIEAKAAGNASREQIFLMLQGLLEDRFKLKAHRETKELPVYALTAARGGFKLQPPKEGSCIPVNPNAPDAPPPPPAPGQPLTLAPCGRIIITMNTSGIGLRGGRIPMPELIGILGTVMGRAVIDKTGITETFDVHLEFTPDESLAGLPRPPAPGPIPATDPAKPSIFAALQEQLGMKLESAKGPVEILVIDHVEKPSAN